MKLKVRLYVRYESREKAEKIGNSSKDVKLQKKKEEKNVRNLRRQYLTHIWILSATAAQSICLKDNGKHWVRYHQVCQSVKGVVRAHEAYPTLSLLLACLPVENIQRWQEVSIGSSPHQFWITTLNQSQGEEGPHNVTEPVSLFGFWCLRKA